jgi:hypothetical protein
MDGGKACEILAMQLMEPNPGRKCVQLPDVPPYPVSGTTGSAWWFNIFTDALLFD